MRKRLPLSGTKISVTKSMAEVQIRLESCGFEQTAQINDKGRYLVTAASGGINFQFEVNLEAIRATMTKNIGAGSQRDIRMGTDRGISKMNQINEQAARVGWRLLALHIKALCDSVELGVIDRAEAFAGNLLLGHKDGQRLTLGQRLKMGAASGELNSPSMFEALQLPRGNDNAS